MKLLIPLLFSITAQAAPRAVAQSTPQQLGEMWVASIKSSNAGKIKALVHPKCPKDSVPDDILKRMISGPMPSQFTIEAVDLGEKDLLRKIYAVEPEKQLNLRYAARNIEDRKKFGLGKGFPIARAGGKWYFVACAKKISKK